MKKTLLLVEDERVILENNRRFFEAEGYRALAAENLRQAREHLARETPGAVILDIMLPDGNGLDLLTELRAAGSKIPVIMLTAWGEPRDISRGYRLGATAYLSKPFDYEALLAVTDGIFASAELLPEIVTRGALTLKIMSDEALVNGENLFLTQKEFSALVLFVQNEGRVLSVEYLYEKVWGQPMGKNSGAAKVTLSKLRAKLRGSGYTVSAKRGKGYVFGAEKNARGRREG